MSKNIYKFHQVMIQNEDTMMIDNNSKIAERLLLLQELQRKEPAAKEKQVHGDGFAAGLHADQASILTEEEQEANDLGQKENNGIEESSARARELLEEAQREAEDIRTRTIEEANTEAEEIQRQAYEDGKQSGYDDGYRDGMAKVDKNRQALESEKKLMTEDYEELLNSLEPRFIAALTDIYEKVFQLDLAKEQNIISHLLSSAMHKMEGGRNYLIHVSGEDYPFVASKKKELLEGTVHAADSIDIVQDMALGSNDCMIETDGGVFDCGLDTQLAELSRKLILLSYTKE